MLYHLKQSSNPSDIHFYCSSGGNAGLACVHAAVALKHPATIVVPNSTSELMKAKLRAAGATDVLQHGASWQDADRWMREDVMAGRDGAIYVPPFDHEQIWEGNKTIVTEVQKQLMALDDEQEVVPDAMICAIGGGGLFNGLCLGMDEIGWSEKKVPLLAMETRGADSLNASLKAGEHVTLPGITSLAKCLGAVRVAAKTYENGQRPNVRSIVLEDAEAAMGCWRLADDERMLVEMACGVCVAMCYEGKLEKAVGKKLTESSRVIIVLCGGSDCTLDVLNDLRSRFGHVEKEMPKKEDVPSALTAPNGTA